MKGLRQYIRKHGKHFTEDLALDATNGKWNKDDIIALVETQVYYNVTGSTIGDIVFLANFAKDSGRMFLRTKHQCIKFALCIVGEYSLHGGVMFDKWVGDTKRFDLTKYI